MNSFEITLDVRPEHPVSELRRLSPTLTYINVLSAKIDENGVLQYVDSRLSGSPEVVPLMTVSCVFPVGAHRLFSDESFFEKLSEYLETGRYKGVNFSFLRLFPFDREPFTAFLKKGAAILHKDGYTVGSIVAPPCAVSLASANDYAAQGEFLDRVNFLLSDCLYRKDCINRRLNNEMLTETLKFASETIPSGKLAVTLADHGLIGHQTVPNALARSIHRNGAEYDDKESYLKLFKKIAAYGVSNISVRPCSRSDRLLFDVLSECFDIIRL